MGGHWGTYGNPYTCKSAVAHRGGGGDIRGHMGTPVPVSLQWHTWGDIEEHKASELGCQQFKPGE